MNSPFISPKSFETPKYLAPSGWAEHIPFSFWLIENLKPKKIVELGTHYGVSYFSFCQAVKDNELPSVCYAIDTWQGDEHAGFYDDTVYQQVKKYNEENYPAFSYLLRTNFDQALGYFEKNTIDLLHIDGLHTYEAVKADFENWYPKMSQTGIVLFHDISVRENDFGVYKIWSELANKFPSFSFVHGFGLGVLAVGEKIPDSISFLFDTKIPANTIYEIRSFYQRLGSSFAEKIILREKERLLRERSVEVTFLNSQRETMHKEIIELGEWGNKVSKEVESLRAEAGEKNKYIDELGLWAKKLSAEVEDLQKLINEKEMAIKKSEEVIEGYLQELRIYDKSQKESEVVISKKDQYIREIEKNNLDQKILIEELRKDLVSQIKINKEFNEELNSKKDFIYRSESDRKALEEKLWLIKSSRGWKLVSAYYRLKDKIIPEHSKQYKFLQKIYRKIRGSKPDNLSPLKTDSFNIPGVSGKETTPGTPTPFIFNVIDFRIFEIPAVSIIIPVYNGWEITYRCIKSIYENTRGVSFEIIVGDDGATDETRNIENYIKNIIVIKNETNLGFLDNCNNAAKRAKGEFILFLNNDTEVRPGWLSSLTELMELDPLIGMTGSKFIYPDGKLQEAGGIIWKDASAWNFGHKQSPDAPEFNYVKEADYISGAGIMIRKKLWEEIGGFDRRYAPAYCEDSDLAFEVRERGFKVVFQPLSEIIHYEGYSHGTDEAGTTIKAYQKRNNEKLREKWKKVLFKDHFPNGENVFWAKDRSRYKKTILVIDHYVPHYDKDAGSKTVFQYLKLFVSLNLNVKFIGDNFFRHEPYTTTLQQMGIEVLYGPRYAENWQQWLKENHDKFDYVLLNRPHISVKYIDFIRENTTAKILYYGHDLHFMRMLKQYEIENKKELLKEAEKWKKIEISLFNKADIVLTPSEQEKKLIEELGVNASVYPIKPYIFDFIPEPINDFSKRKNILFVGGFTHGPNTDAVLWFVKEVWPLVKKNISDAKFFVVGSNVPPEILALSGDDIDIIGFLSETDLGKLYKKIKMVVIPLRYGAGVKGKTVEAMYNGIPFVATEFGIEGLPDWPGFLTSKKNADEFAHEVIRLYNASDKELTALSEMEAKYIHDHFHLESVKKEFQEILDTLTISADAV